MCCRMRIAYLFWLGNAEVGFLFFSMKFLETIVTFVKKSEETVLARLITMRKTSDF